MNTNLIKSIGFMALGGIAGGLAGYFLASLVIDKVLNPQEEFEWEEVEENINTEIRVGKSEVVKANNQKKDYTKAFDKGDLEELVKPYTTKVKSKQDNIAVISVQEYESNRTLNRELITYYSGDVTFCDTNEEIIPNPEDFFGANIHLRFGEGSDDPDIVYVRNDNNGVCYEITQVPGKYHVIVLGEPDKEPKQTKKRRRTTKKDESFETDEESIENEGED